MREQNYFWSPCMELILHGAPRKVDFQSQTKIHLKDYPEGHKSCLNCKCWLLKLPWAEFCELQLGPHILSGESDPHQAQKF